jgi:hypothetical protein
VGLRLGSIIGELAGRNEHRGEDDRVQAEDPGRPKALQAEVALVGSFMIASLDAVLHGV